MSEKLPKGTSMILLLLFLGTFIDGIDVSIVNVALPTMSRDFSITLSQSSWVVFAYVVSMAALLLPLGKKAKNNRTKKYLIFGTVLFAISSFACGLSEYFSSFWILVVFRLLQGVAAAFMSCVFPTVIVTMLPVDRKGLGMSVMGASTGVSMILGPIIGGAVISLLGQWSWLFYINIPICILILILVMKFMPADGEPDRSKDPSRLGGISALFLIGSTLIFMEDIGDSASAYVRVICIAVAAVSAYLLYTSIKKDTQRAVIAPQMLRNRDYLLVGMSFLLSTVVISGANYILPYVLQINYEMSPGMSGLYLAVISVTLAIAVLPVGKMCDVHGCRTPSALSIVFRATFCVIMVFVLMETKNPLFLIPPLIFLGLSGAFSGTSQSTRMIHHATKGYEDEATNFMIVANCFAGALGTVLFALVFSLTTHQTISDITQDLMAKGFTATMWFSVALLAVAMVCTLVVKNKIVRKE